MKVSAILFDLDGTLLDTLEDLGGSMNNVLDRKGFPLHEIDEYRYFVGEGLSMLVKRALPANSSNAVCSDSLAAMRAEYNAHCRDNTAPYPGIPELLTKISNAGLKMTVLSNKPHAMTVSMVAGCFPEVTFDIVNGGRENVPLKPNPAGALEIARLLKIEPGQFVYLGDSKTDMETAVASGMYPVGALWGFRNAEELEKAGAKALVASPDELWKILEKSNYSIP